MGVLLILLLLALPISWLFAELRGNKATRIALGALTIIVAAVVAYIFGDVSERFGQNAYFANYNTRLLDATIEQLDRGNTETVKSALKELRDQYHPNYENTSHYDQLVEAAIAKMAAPRAVTSSPTRPE